MSNDNIVLPRQLVVAGTAHYCINKVCDGMYWSSIFISAPIGYEIATE